jgi:hypothetical protein
MTATLTGTPAALFRLNPNDISNVPARRIAGCPGVTAKELWRSDAMIDTLLIYEPGATTPGYPHPGAHHHIWIVDGQADIGGRTLSTGSYVHVPPGVAHPITADGASGCVLLHLHRRTTA